MVRQKIGKPNRETTHIPTLAIKPSMSAEAIIPLPTKPADNLDIFSACYVTVVAFEID